MDTLVAIETFLRPHLPLEKPLLVGFSGGEDSVALIKALEALKVPHELAHFDHGWREESREEAQRLKQRATAPFHLKRSENPIKSEQCARDERYAFFEALFGEGDFTALILAHHRNDQAETVLKRVLEGSQLPNLKGILPIAYRKGMPIWRPLLTVSKGEIRAYLGGEEFIDDVTNLDPQYLRGRMRTSILPALSETFGKEVEAPLAQLGDYGAELSSYLEEKQTQFPPILGPFGTMWDFSGAHSFEIRSILGRHLSASRPIFDQIIAALQAGRANQTRVFGKEKVVVDRGRLYWIKGPLPRFNQIISLEEGSFDVGGWTFDIQFGGEESRWWEGKFSLTVPYGGYRLVPADGAFRKEWNQEKVPAFLRDCLPILTENGAPVAHFFGHSAPFKKNSKVMRVNIEIKQKVCYTDVKG